MKLIDLLVRELPKRGGWPERAVKYKGYTDYALAFDANRNLVRGYGSTIGCDVIHEGQIVTREQYEAALAASKPQWNGKFPIPAGTDVEVHFDGDDSRAWTLFRVEYMAGEVVVLRDYRIDGVDAYKQRTLSFRPIHSEADDGINNNALDKLVDGYGIDHWASLAKERFHKVNDLESELIEVRKMLTEFYRSLKEGMMHHKIVTDEE